MKRSDPQDETEKLVHRFIAANKCRWSKRTAEKYGYLLAHLVNWMRLRKLRLDDLSSDRIKDLEGYLFKLNICKNNQYSAKCIHYRFILWLYSKKKIDHHPKNLFPGMHQIDRPMLQVELPEVTLEFFEFVGTHLKKSTCSSYRSGLRHFYLFCKKEDLTPEHMKRRHFESFLKYLAKTGISPTGRKSIIMRVRSYLRWLYEHDCLKESPETLLKTSDIPKMPKYLPRPIPFEIDQEIQKRFSSSNDICHQALLLIRKTGMRAGEAPSLSYDCLKTDGYGNYSLKVPLGKLNKERMVPLDIDTVNLIEAIRKKCDGYSPKKRNYLICSPSGCKISYLYLMFAFKESTYDIKTDQPLVIHRLRHSYATTLLNAGMSLLSLKEVLGHQDIKMTLCYAAITQKTVRDEYLSAMKNLTEQYHHSKIQKINSSSNSHLQTYDDLIMSLKKTIGDNKKIAPKRITAIMKRINRLKSDLAHLFEE